MANENNKEVVQRMVNAIEQPDHPGRNKAITALEAGAQKHQRNKIILSFIFQAIFFLLSLTVLTCTWSQNSTISSRWAGLIFGSFTGVILCITAEKRKSFTNKPVSPAFTLIGSSLVIITGLLINAIKSILSPSITVWATVFLTTFFVIVLGYSMSVDYQKINASYRQKT